MFETLVLNIRFLGWWGEGLAFCVEGLIFDCLGICASHGVFNINGRQSH